MSTEDTMLTAVLRSMGDRVEHVGGTMLSTRTLLHLHSGDYLYDDDWMTARPVRLLVSFVGITFRTGNVEYVVIEGLQLPRPRESARARIIAVRVDALAGAVQPADTRTGDHRLYDVSPHELRRSDM